MRGKKSLAVDFERPEGQDIVRRLAAQADVLIENFKTGGLAKYGLDYASLSKVNPRLIYCSITGFGHDGPYAHRAGYDFIIQGMGGMMDLTGEAEREGQKPGVAIADVFTGLYSVIAIQAALRQREVSGRGAEIDMALFDTQLAVLANQAMNYFVTGAAPRRMGNAHPNLVPYQVFEAADGPLIVACGNDRQARDFCRIVGRADLADDPTYRSNADRIKNRVEYIAALGGGDLTDASRRVARGSRESQRAGRPDQHHRRSLRRPAGARARHAAGPACDRRKGRDGPGAAGADPHRRRRAGGRARRADAGRAHARGAGGAGA